MILILYKLLWHFYYILKILLFLQVGIVTTKIGKCLTGTIFIRVSAFYNWILDNTADATYCQNPFWSRTKEEEKTERTLLITEKTSTTEYQNTEEEKFEDHPFSSKALNIQISIYLIFFTSVNLQWLSFLSGEFFFPQWNLNR